MPEALPAITDLVPHAGPMCLLDRALAADDHHLIAEVTISKRSLFWDGAGVGAWVGIEFMAQAVAAWAGWRARQAGGVPKLGFLLGSRRYEAHVPRFTEGQTLQVWVQQQFQADSGLGLFDCDIRIDQQTVASAALTVFEPADPEAFLKGAA